MDVVSLLLMNLLVRIIKQFYENIIIDILGTIGKRLASINVENNEENRMKYRKLLFEAPAHVGEALGGCILFHETLYQKDNNGKLITDNLKERGIIRGIKVKSWSSTGRVLPRPTNISFLAISSWSVRARP